MAHVNINLLPSNFNVQKGILNAAENIKKIIIGGIVLFIFLVSGGFLATYFLSQQLNTQITRNTQLKNEIASIESIEQKYFLVKDRIGKVSTVLKLRTMDNLITDLEGMLSNLPVGVQLSRTDLNTNKIEVEFDANSSQAAVALLAQIAQSENYKEITLMNFQFNELTGYKITFELTKNSP